MRINYNKKSFGKQELVLAILSKSKVSEAKAEQCILTLLDAVKKGLGRGQRVEVRRFGIFTTAPKRITRARNPKTGEPAVVKPGRVVRFKASQKFQC